MYFNKFPRQNNTTCIKNVKLCLVNPGSETNFAYIKSNFEVHIIAPLCNYK